MFHFCSIQNSVVLLQTGTIRQPYADHIFLVLLPRYR